MSCTPNPCFNRGTCVSDVNGGFFGCFCQTGFSGLYCQDGTVVCKKLKQLREIFILKTEIYCWNIILASECKTNPCFNNGICLESQTGKFAGCYCTSGYSGYYCQNYNCKRFINQLAKAYSKNQFKLFYFSLLLFFCNFLRKITLKLKLKFLYALNEEKRLAKNSPKNNLNKKN